MKRRLLLGLAAGVVLALAPAGAAEKNSAETYRLLNLFGDVFERVRNDYVEPVADQELVESAINGMLTALDPHSAYLNAKSYRDMQVQTRGEFGGLGIEVSQEAGFVKVVSPIDDTPAHRAGIQPGDLITHLDGESVQGLTLNEAVDKMRGPPNTQIKLTIRRGTKDPFDLTLTRAVIRIQTVRHRIEGTIAYIRITQFNEQADAGLKKALNDIKTELGKKLNGVVLDLRNNPGGLLDQAVAVSDAFLDQGEIVSTRSRRPEETQRYNARRGDIAEGLPIVVLINDGSASASEIVAGALQDHKRAVLVGSKSFGKGSVQTIIPLPGYGAVKLTTARYYTPSGRSIQQVGIAPDHEVKVAKADTPEGAQPSQENRRTEASLPKSLKNENGPAKAEPPPAPAKAAPPGNAARPPADHEGLRRPSDDPAQDAQLQKALELLRTGAVRPPSR
ncbi:MAG: S41 family peptidase [Rhodospirillales bacterium]|nr:S41 family peptidase [Rhodospirillales bacterium]